MKINNHGFTVLELLNALFLVAVLAGMCGIAYTIGHFVSKFW